MKAKTPCQVEFVAVLLAINVAKDKRWRSVKLLSDAHQVILVATK